MVVKPLTPSKARKLIRDADPATRAELIEQLTAILDAADLEAIASRSGNAHVARDRRYRDSIREVIRQAGRL